MAVHKQGRRHLYFRSYLQRVSSPHLGTIAVSILPQAGSEQVSLPLLQQLNHDEAERERDQGDQRESVHFGKKWAPMSRT